MPWKFVCYLRFHEVLQTRFIRQITERNEQINIYNIYIYIWLGQTFLYVYKRGYRKHFISFICLDGLEKVEGESIVQKKTKHISTTPPTLWVSRISIFIYPSTQFYVLLNSEPVLITCQSKYYVLSLILSSSQISTDCETTLMTWY